MYKRVFFGQVVNKSVAALKDINSVEFMMFLLLSAAVLWIGLYPEPLLNVLHTSIGQLLQTTMHSKIAAASSTGTGLMPATPVPHGTFPVPPPLSGPRP